MLLYSLSLVLELSMCKWKTISITPYSNYYHGHSLGQNLINGNQLKLNWMEKKPFVHSFYYLDKGKFGLE